MAQQTDRGIVLAEALIELLRQQRIILPTIDVIERVCGEALTLGTCRVYEALTGPLIDFHRRALRYPVGNSRRHQEQWADLAEFLGRDRRRGLVIWLIGLNILRKHGVFAALFVTDWDSISSSEIVIGIENEYQLSPAEFSNLW